MARRGCSVCENAYGTRYICAKCRQGVITYRDKDGTVKTWSHPSLAKGWVETSGDNTGQGTEVAVEAFRETDRPAVFDGTVKAVEFTDAERAVALGIWLGHTDAHIARTTGLSRTHVGRIRTKFLGEEMKPNFSWMTEESQQIIVLIGQDLSDEEIAATVGVGEDHVIRIRALVEKASRRIPYAEYE